MLYIKNTHQQTPMFTLCMASNTGRNRSVL